MLISTSSVPFQLFVCLFCLNPHVLGVLQGGWEQEQKDPGRRWHWSVLGAGFLCYVSSNSAEMSLIMEICGECLVGVLQFLFFHELL